MTRERPPATASSASSHEARAPPTIGWSSRPPSPSVSPSAEPFEHSRPRLEGCSGSPAVAAPPRPSGAASTPQPTPQYGHVVRTGGRGSETCTVMERSIHVGLVAARLLKALYEDDGFIDGSSAVLRDDIDEGGFHVLGHALGIAADVEMRALREPAPQLRPDLAHAILHVDLVCAVARPGERQAGEQARVLHGGQLVLVEKIAVLALVTEEEPVPAPRAARL